MINFKFKTMEREKSQTKNVFFETAFGQIENILKAALENGEPAVEIEKAFKNFFTEKCKESFKNGIEVGKKKLKGKKDNRFREKKYQRR